MLPAEAREIGKLLERISPEQMSPCLNLGSSTGEFRTVVQPYIHDGIIAPNEKRGVSFIHADLKAEPGVNVAGDVFDPEYQAKLAGMRPASVMCCNIFEHVTDRQMLADICRKIVRPAGYLLISVPYSFPYHIDPIDTYFRPTPEELLRYFPDDEVVSTKIVDDESYWQELKKQPPLRRFMTIIKIIAHVPLPFVRFEIWKCKMHRLLWLFRPYRVSILLLRVSGKTHTEEKSE